MSDDNEDDDEDEDEEEDEEEEEEEDAKAKAEDKGGDADNNDDDTKEEEEEDEDEDGASDEILPGARTLAAKTRRHLALSIKTRLQWWREMVATSFNLSDVSCGLHWPARGGRRRRGASRVVRLTLSARPRCSRTRSLLLRTPILATPLAVSVPRDPHRLHQLGQVRAAHALQALPQGRGRGQDAAVRSVRRWLPHVLPPSQAQVGAERRCVVSGGAPLAECPMDVVPRAAHLVLTFCPVATHQTGSVRNARRRARAPAKGPRRSAAARPPRRQTRMPARRGLQPAAPTGLPSAAKRCGSLPWSYVVLRFRACLL